MLAEHIDSVLRNARYEMLEDGTYYGEIPDFSGVWANAADLAVCKKELREVLKEWLTIKNQKNVATPVGNSHKIPCRA